jgi:6-phosphogluconolactonase
LPGEITPGTSQTPSPRAFFRPRPPNAGRDSIVGFQVDPDTGHLTLIGHNPCERVPRTFTIDPSGKYLYVAGQGDSRLGAYAINPDTGALTKIEQHETGNRPIWVQASSLD